MTKHPLKDITFVHCTEKPHVFPSETSSTKLFKTIPCWANQILLVGHTILNAAIVLMQRGSTELPDGQCQSCQSRTAP